MTQVKPKAKGSVSRAAAPRRGAGGTALRAVCTPEDVGLCQRRPERAIGLDLGSFPGNHYRRVPGTLARPPAVADATRRVIDVPRSYVDSKTAMKGGGKTVERTAKGQ